LREAKEIFTQGYGQATLGVEQKESLTQRRNDGRFEIKLKVIKEK